MAGETSTEKRLKRLEEWAGKFSAAFSSLSHKANQVAEDSSRDAKPLQNAAGNGRYAIVSTTITAASGSTLGMGMCVLQTTTYADGTDVGTNADSGDPVLVYSGAANTIATDRTIIVINIFGRYNVIVDFCD